MSLLCPEQQIGSKSFVFKCRFFNRKKVHKRGSSSEERVLMPPRCTWRCSVSPRPVKGLGREAGPGLWDLSGCPLPHHAPLAGLPEPLRGPSLPQRFGCIQRRVLRSGEPRSSPPPPHPATSGPGWWFCGAQGPRGRAQAAGSATVRGARLGAVPVNRALDK